MTREHEIRSMYAEISNYSGDFGDPIIDTFSFDPWQLFNQPNLTDYERKGVLVSMLVELMSAIDNSTQPDVVNSKLGRKARLEVVHIA